MTVRVRNDGTLAWEQQYAQYPAAEWPMLRLGYAIVDAADPATVPEGPLRTLLPRPVAPGEIATFVNVLTAPDAEGEYAVVWDLVSERFCWFQQCGSAPHRTHLSVSA